jgi:hypothetical protein
MNHSTQAIFFILISVLFSLLLPLLQRHEVAGMTPGPERHSRLIITQCAHRGIRRIVHTRAVLLDWVVFTRGETKD